MVAKMHNGKSKTDKVVILAPPLRDEHKRKDVFGNLLEDDVRYTWVKQGSERYSQHCQQ